MLCCFVVTQQYFSQRRALASSLSMSGMSMGTLAAGPLYQYLIDLYCWQGCLIIMSGVLLNLVVVGATFMPVHQKKSAVQTGIVKKRTSSSCECRLLKIFAGKLRDPTVLKNPCFILYCIGTFSWCFGALPFYPHTPTRAALYGINRNLVALLPTYVGISTFVARIIFGFFANLKCTNRILQYSLSVLTAGILLGLYNLAVTYHVIVVFCVVIGAINGMFVVGNANLH